MYFPVAKVIMILVKYYCKYLVIYFFTCFGESLENKVTFKWLV